MSRERLQQAGIVLLASLRILCERARAHAGVCKAVKVTGLVLIAALILVLDGFVGARIGQKMALETYADWMEAYRIERMAIDQANAEADPYELQLQAEAREFGKVMHGMSRFEYSYDEFEKLAWCMDARVRNPRYADDMITVIRQPEQWPGYDPGNEVTQDEYETALKIVTAIHEAEYPKYASSFVHARFDRDGITLFESM